MSPCLAAVYSRRRTRLVRSASSAACQAQTFAEKDSRCPALCAGANWSRFASRRSRPALWEAASRPTSLGQHCCP